MSLRFKLAVFVGVALGMAGCSAVDSFDTSETTQDVVSTNLTTYVSGQDIIVTFDGMQGATTDWIALAHPTDPPNVYEAWKYTGGGASGSITFFTPHLGAGTYQARAFYNWSGTASYTVQQTSANFTITGGAMLAATQASYPFGASVPIDYSGFSGAPTDWISIHKPGTADSNYVAFQFTSGGGSGQRIFMGLSPGTYEARYHADWNGTHNYGTLAVSPQFTVSQQTTIKTDSPSYGANQSIAVTYTNLPGNALDYVAVSAAGSAASSTIQRFYTSGTTNGTQVFAPLPAGNYEARAYLNDTATILATSTFTVTATTLTTDQSMYTTTQGPTVTFSGMPGNAMDWIAISAVGSSASSYVQFWYTGGLNAGSHTFAALPTGNYEARAYYNNSLTVSARSAPFSVGPVCNVPATPPVLSGITSGDLAIPADMADATATLSAPLGTSILFATVREGEPSPQHGDTLCELVAEGVHCKRNRLGTDSPSSSGIINIHWSVATFTSGVTVQRGITDTFMTNPQTVTLTAVDPASSFVLLGGSFVGGTGWGNNEFTRARLVSGTSLEVAHSVAGAAVAWQVVTMSGATVTRGTTTLATNVTAQSVAIPTAPSGSMLLASYTSDNPNGIPAAALMLQSRLANPTSLQFERNLGGSNLDVSWELVSLPFATRLGRSNFAAGVSTLTEAVTGIAPATSVALSSSQSILGQSGGSTAYNGPDVDLVGEAAFSMATAANSLVLQRQASSAASSIAWTVIDFSKNCAGN